MAVALAAVPSVLTALETIDKPLPTTPTPLPSYYLGPALGPAFSTKPSITPLNPVSTSSVVHAPSSSPVSPILTSPVLDAITTPLHDYTLSEPGPRAGAGPSRSRYMFIAVRSGRRPGVYTSWSEAQKQVVNHPSAVYKTFSTRLAAEAFISGWDGAGRHSLPSSSPRPLREHLAVTFPSACPPTPPSSVKRPSYHARLLHTLPTLPSDAIWSPDDPDQFNMPDFAPPLRHASSYNGLSPMGPTVSFRNSTVRTSSPLRLRVDEPQIPVDTHPAEKRRLYKATSLMGLSGFRSSPSLVPIEAGPSQTGSKPSVMDRSRPTKGDSQLWAAGHHRTFAHGSGNHLGVAALQQSSTRRKATPSPLWLDSTSSEETSPTQEKPRQQSYFPSKPPSPSPEPAPSLADSAPKFSRSDLRKSGVVMPVAAPRPASALGLPRLPKSRNSISPSPSLSSLRSASTDGRRISRQPSFNPSLSSLSQDRLSALAEDRGGLDFGELEPPRPAFMRKKSSNPSLSSLSSLSSSMSASLSSLSGTSSPTPSIVDEEDDDVEVMNASNGEAEVPHGTEAVQSKLHPSHETVSLPLGASNGPIAPQVKDKDNMYPVRALKIPPRVHLDTSRDIGYTDNQTPYVSSAKSDGDASIESTSLKSGKVSGGNKTGGGLFKRFSRALKMEKKVVPDYESGRRGSL